jgi:YgiT-type zinc finger domain-containing protein
MEKKEEETMKCPECGGEFVRQKINYEQRWKERLYSFEDVPALVCSQCDNSYLEPKTATTIDKIILEHKKPAKYISVPTFSLSRKAVTS